MERELTLVTAPGPLEGRLGQTLRAALAKTPLRLAQSGEALENRRLLFAFSLPENGWNGSLGGCLGWLRDHPGCLRGSVGGVVIDGAGDLYTKAAGRELILAASLAGCAFPGRPLVEATGGLQNFTVQARNGDCDLETAYCRAVSDLAGRVGTFAPPRRARPRVLALHASSRSTSNTLDLWGRVRGVWRNSAPSGSWACGTEPWRTAPGAPIPPVSTSGSGGAAFTAASWFRRSFPPSGRRTRWSSSAPTTTTLSPPTSPPP